MVTHTGGHMSPADESLVLLMFRKFDPAAFAGIERVDGSLRVFRSKAGDEQLWFEASARLVRMQLQTSRGDVTLEIDHYSRVREDVDNGFEFPTRVTVTVQHEPPVSNDHRHDFRYKFHNLRFNFADGTKVTLDWPGVQETLDLTNEVPPGTGRVEIRRTIRNPGLTDFTLDFEYLAGESTWRFEPTRGRIVVSPGESALLKVDATFDPQRPAAPLPRVRGWFGEGEWRSEPVEMSLRPIVRRRAVAARVDRPPTPDGIIVPGEYGGEQPCKAFAELQSGSGPPFDTEFCVAYDDRAIYVAITAFEDRATSRHQAETRRDGDLRADDSVELFFDAVNARTNYRYFAVSAANVQFDALGGPDRGPFGDVTWDAEWSSAVKAYDDRVVYEIAIPYSALGVRPSRPGDAWGFNVCRNRRRNPAEAGSWRLWSQWTLTYSRQHKPQHFGELVFA